MIWENDAPVETPRCGFVPAVLAWIISPGELRENNRKFLNGVRRRHRRDSGLFLIADRFISLAITPSFFVRRLFFAQRRGQQFYDLAFAQELGVGDNGAVAGVLIVFDALASAIILASMTLGVADSPIHSDASATRPLVALHVSPERFTFNRLPT